MSKAMLTAYVASFSAPDTNIDTASGGRVTSDISTPRQIQFALKYNF